MSISYHKIQNLPFYSLNQFTQLQPLSRGKSAIYLYQHNESNEVFVVKQVPFSQQKLKIYEILIRLYNLDSLVRIRGICKMIIKYEKFKKKRNHQISEQSLYFLQDKNQQIKQQQSQKKQIKNNIERRKEQKNSTDAKQQQWLLLFMQKCTENLVEHIKNRKRQRRPFKCQQVTNFISQTLLLLQTLQKQHISHRDIKPENFLYERGKFKLCDFDDSIYLDPQGDGKRQYDLTTVQYTSPEFFRNFRQPKNKIFDPYKLDLYALGITIIYMCSMGKFNLSERRQYLQQNSVFHSNFMKQQRRRFLKNNDEYKNLNTIVKMMLEQDQYKRDTFVTFLMKIKPIMNLRQLQIHMIDQQAMSQNSKSQQSRRKLTSVQKKHNKTTWENTTQIQRKSLKSLLILAFSFFVLIFII